mgnify:FL=1
MSAYTDGDAFSQVIEKLLTGEIICEVTEEQLYKYLNDPSNQKDVDSYLRRIGRVLRSSQDSSGYYAAYRDISNPSVKLQIKKKFSEAINDLEPLIRWLRLASSAEKSGAPIKPGDTLRGSELLQAIESAPSLVDELDRLSRTKLFSNTSAGSKKQLDSILKRLCDNGYLVARGASGSVFIATGKWARLYETLQFIASHEQLDSEEGAPEQAEILH